MGMVRRFEDLVAWQKARWLAVAVYKATRTGPLERDFGLSGQMQRAVVSIPSNIAEGFERGTRPEFHRYLSNAKGSSAELRTQLYIAHDIEYLTQTQFDSLFAQAEEVGRTIGGLRMAVQRQKATPRRRP